MSLITDFRARNGLVPTPSWWRAIQFGALFGSLVGIVLYRAWGLFACPVIFLPLIFLSSSVKRIYWYGFDPFIWRASDAGRFGRAMFWNGLTVALDWLFPLLTILICLFLMEHFPIDESVPRTLRAFVFWCAVFPPRLFILASNPFLMDPDRILEGTVVPCYAFLTMLMPLGLGWLVGALCLVTLVGIPFVICRKLPEYRRNYEKCLNETRQGILHDYRQAGCWFPRPGVIFEPNFGAYSPVDGATLAEIKGMLTVLRANAWGFWLSLLELIGGFVWTICSGRLALILLVPVFILVGLLYGMVVSEADRSLKGPGQWIRGLLLLGAICAIAVPSLYWGGRDPAMLGALGVLFSASWFFCVGFLVRETSRGVFDTLEYLLVLLALACIFLARGLGCTWYESLLPAFFFCCTLSRIRRYFPRTDLPPAAPDLETTANSASGKTAAHEDQARSARKRERQLAALRRSSRRSGR